MAAQVGSIQELLDYLELTADEVGYSEQAARGFPLRLPQALLRRMEKRNPQDPLLRQILPHRQELLMAPGFGTDPVGESAYAPVPGLLHKYPGRALLITTGACAINCR